MRASIASVSATGETSPAAMAGAISVMVRVRRSATAVMDTPLPAPYPRGVDVRSMIRAGASPSGTVTRGEQVCDLGVVRKATAGVLRPGEAAVNGDVEYPAAPFDQGHRCGTQGEQPIPHPEGVRCVVSHCAVFNCAVFNRHHCSYPTSAWIVDGKRD